MSQTIYAPSDSLTRAQFLKMMATAFYSADLQTAGDRLYEADALAQVGAVVLEEERADVGRALTALIGRDEIPDEAEILAKNCGKE